jgi:uncharacterized SAM-binding protein YcdF (DUF218 family)
MISFLINIFTNGHQVFGLLFPALFTLAFLSLSIIIYKLFCHVFAVKLEQDTTARTNRTMEALATIAVLIGSLQTVTSLCIVGFSLVNGELQAGVKAFAILIQGFASTGFGISIATINRGYLYLFADETLRKKEDHDETDNPLINRPLFGPGSSLGCHHDRHKRPRCHVF